ncbi:MAG: HD domain-containing phosphohydrolase [Chloroflexota bacterium]
MSELVPIPAALFQLAGQPPFPVLDEQGGDIAATLGGAQPAERMVYVAGEQLPDLRVHLLRCVPRVAGNLQVEAYLRAWMLYNVLTFEVAALFENRELPGNAGNSRNLLEVTRAVGREGALWAASGQVPSYRHRHLVGETFSSVAHAVNTALYSATIAAASGEENYEALQGVALAAVFADIALDEEDNERSRIDKATILMRRFGVPSVGAVAGVLARYAHWDGSGTPRLAGQGIPFEGRCIAITADYDILVTGGGGESARTPYEALSVMSERHGTYDPMYLRYFVRLIARMRVQDDESSLAAAS